MNEYPLSLVEKLSFVRYGGTLEEARAAQEGSRRQSRSRQAPR